MSWQNLQMMMQDLPWYEYEKKDEEKVIPLNEEQEREFLKKFKKNG